MARGELEPGDRCEAYRIVRLIAAGGMGDVYEAVHEPTGQIAAIKCLKVTHHSREDARARMKMEAVVLSELKHANLVRVYDAGVHQGGMIWIAMERLYGKTLRQMIGDLGAMPVAEALHYACEVSDGVDALHSVHVIHRDLKPENVFVTREGQVKVLDLGTGKFTGYGLYNTNRMRIVGTTAYMAPEHIRGLAIDGRADVYALGLMLYEMLTGRHALLSAMVGELPDDMERLVCMQLGVEPAPLAEIVPNLPPYIASAVARAVAKDRDRRPASMSEFGRELRACRKRYIAESHAEHGGRCSHPPVADLRQKLGARIPSNIPLERHGARARALPAPAPANDSSRSTALAHVAEPLVRAVASVGTDDMAEGAAWPSRPSPGTTLDLGSSPGGLVETVPTDRISDSSERPSKGIPGSAIEGTSLAESGVLRNSLSFRTTNTNPLWPMPPSDGARARGDGSQPNLPPIRPIDIASGRQRRGAHARRIGWTVLLGAVLGLPPALLAIWLAGRKSPRLPPTAPTSEWMLEKAPPIPRGEASVRPTSVGFTAATEGTARNSAVPSASAAGETVSSQGLRVMGSNVGALPSSTSPLLSATGSVDTVAAKRSAAPVAGGTRTELANGTPPTARSAATGVLLSPDWGEGEEPSSPAE